MPIQYNRCYLCGKKAPSGQCEDRKKCGLAKGRKDVTYSRKTRIMYWLRWFFGKKCYVCNHHIKGGYGEPPRCIMCYCNSFAEDILTIAAKEDRNSELLMLMDRRNLKQKEITIREIGDFCVFFKKAG